jgi:ABC-type nitrate/sulfonate/bicarbonate transport system permease component
VSRRGLAVTTLALLVLWQLASLALQTNVLPGPTAVVAALVEQLPRGLGWHLVVSAGRILAAILLTIPTAAPLGIMIGQNRRWNQVLSPAVYLTYPIPKIVLLPIIMLFLGIGDAAKVFIIWMVLFFQVLVVVRDAASAVRPELVQSVYSLGASRWQLLRYVYLPACTPAILTSLRVTTGTAIAVLFISESFATVSGLGYYIMVEAWGRMAYADMYAGVVAMSLLGLSLYFALDQIEKRACEWLDPPAQPRLGEGASG